MTSALHATDLGKQYGRKWALSNCTLDIPDGHVVGLVGPNGAGKTTLLHLAVGLLTPTTGTVEVGGETPASSAEQLVASASSPRTRRCTWDSASRITCRWVKR